MIVTHPVLEPEQAAEVLALMRLARIPMPQADVCEEVAARMADGESLVEALTGVDRRLAEAHLARQREADARRREALDLDHALARLRAGDRGMVAENGNKDARTFTTQREIAAGAVYRSEGLKKLPRHVRDAHICGDIHFHDLDRSPHSAMANCSLPDFARLLRNGFVLGNARIEQPQSVGVAATLLVQLFGAISGEQYGGISVHELDRLLEPYAEKSLAKNRALYAEVLPQADAVEVKAREKTARDIHDAMQAFEYQVNTLTTAAAQTPFTSVSFGLATSWTAREIQRSILHVRLRGMSGETAIFPKLLYLVDEGVNYSPGEPNHDIRQLAEHCATRRIYPDLISVPRIRELKEGQVITPMGCRSFLHPWRNSTGQPEVVGRNNLGVVTVNVPRAALGAHGDEAAFFSRLDRAIDTALQALEIREQVVLEGDLNSAPVMYTQGGLGDPAGKDTVRDFYTGNNAKRSSISLGYTGLHNALTALTGTRDWGQHAPARELSRRILARMQERIDAAQHRFACHLSLYATPSESLCERFAALDRAWFGEVAGVNDREYYENSFHFASHMEIDPLSKIDFEAAYRELTPGGFMYYVEAPNLTHNPAALTALWNAAFEQVGYFGVNTPIDSCFECGFEGEFNCDELGYVCPGCGNRDETRASVTRRLCGYLGSPMKRPVVEGRQSEISARVKHL